MGSEVFKVGDTKLTRVDIELKVVQLFIDNCNPDMTMVLGDYINAISDWTEPIVSEMSPDLRDPFYECISDIISTLRVNKFIDTISGEIKSDDAVISMSLYCMFWHFLGKKEHEYQC